MPPRLIQTSPYLTHVVPGAASAVTYWTDTFGSAYPQAGPPPADAVFGIVGLDRQVVWQSDRLVLDMLRACAAGPREAGQMALRFGAERVAAAVARTWLQRPGDLCREYRLVSGEIEITAHCNWGCQFCPVSTVPKPRQTMPIELFETVIAKLAAVSSIDYVTFQFFNEPTLDKHFTDRIEVLRRHGMKLALYTNASALTQEKIDCLRRSGVLRHLIVNMPSADPAEFAELTGSRGYAQTTRNLELAIDAGFRVQVVVNGVGARQARNVRELTRRYGPMGAEVAASLTCDRAGEVGGAYFQDVHAGGRLSGCGWPVSHVNVSVTGDLFLCCNDYYQREVFGNIRDGSIHDLMAGPAAVKARRKVFGVAEAGEDFICRRCHNQRPDFPGRSFRPIATFG